MVARFLLGLLILAFGKFQYGMQIGYCLVTPFLVAIQVNRLPSNSVALLLRPSDRCVSCSPPMGMVRAAEVSVDRVEHCGNYVQA